MRDKYITHCPYCGGTEMVEAYQGGYGAASGVENILSSVSIYHVVCRNCGSIVRSFVKDPEKLLKKKDRRKYSQ